MGIIQPVWKEKFCFSNLIKQLHEKKRNEFGFYFKKTKKKEFLFFYKRKTTGDDDDEYRKVNR
jgi:predicted CopG family antitoxin